jgi:hypothetical protein
MFIRAIIKNRNRAQITHAFIVIHGPTNKYLHATINRLNTMMKSDYFCLRFLDCGRSEKTPWADWIWREYLYIAACSHRVRLSKLRFQLSEFHLRFATKNCWFMNILIWKSITCFSLSTFPLIALKRLFNSSRLIMRLPEFF